MKRKIYLSLLIGTLVTALFAVSAFATKDYTAENVDVLIAIQADGSLLVTETMVFQFAGGPFTYVFRDLSRTGTDGLQVLYASMDGISFPTGKNTGQVEIVDGDPLKVTWHFAPLTDSTHEFLLRYRVEGAVRTGEADTLRWYAIPQDHDYSIARSNISVDYPPGVQPLAPPILDRDFKSFSTDQGVRLSTQDISSDESVIVTVRFPPGSLARTTPHWQVQQAQESAASTRAIRIGTIAGSAALALGLLGLFIYVRANRRDLNLPEQTPLPTPPADVPPAVIGKLTGHEGHSAMGALFAMAQRGVLEIHEQKGFWGSKKHVLELAAGDFPLNLHEQGLLEAVLKPGETQVNLSEIATRLANKKKLFYEPLEEDLIRRGWLDTDRKRKSSFLVITGLLTMVITLLIFILSMVLAGLAVSGKSSGLEGIAAVAGISAGLFLLSLGLIIYGATYSPLTPEGEAQAVRWKGFAIYLKHVSKGKEPAISPDYFERYLAYAAVFSLGANWAKYFQQLGGVPLPIWYHAMAGSEGEFGAMVAVMSASDSAGASAGGDGGGGASGGGASGAG